jgi:hypothetical protein
MRAVIGACVVAGCAFKAGAPYGGAASTADAPQALGDAAPDGPGWPSSLFASSGATLYAIDVDGMRYTAIGSVHDMAGTLYTVNALAYSEGQLYGITATGDTLITIDRATALVTASVALSETHMYWGMTAAPPGDVSSAAVLFAATNDTSNNMFMVALDGTMTQLGSFGNDHAIAGDLAWVHGHGLYATVTGAPCNSQCLALVDTTTGAATMLDMNEPGDMWGLSGYRDQLWVLHGSGEIDTADPRTGQLTLAFMAGTTNWFDGD